MSIKTDKFKDYFLKIVDSISDISEIENDWLNLIQRSCNKNIYTYPNYYETQFSTRSPNSNPYLIVFYKSSIPVAIIVGKTIRRKLPIKFGYLKFNSITLNLLEVEIDGIITDDNIFTIENINLYISHLQKNKSFDVIELQHFSERNPLWKIITKSQISERVLAFQSKEYLCELRDPKTGKQLIYHKAKTLRNFRRSDKIITRELDNLSIKEYRNLKDINEFILNADQICRKSYHCELGVGIEDNLFWRTKIEDMMQGNYFLGFILYSDSKPIAYNFGQIFDKYFYGFNMSFDLSYRKYQPGTYLLRRIIEKLIRLEIDFYHLGYGEAEYKKIYSNLSYRETTFQFFSDSLQSKIVYIILLSTQKINHITISLLERMGIVNKIKKIWRSNISAD